MAAVGGDKNPVQLPGWLLIAGFVALVLPQLWLWQFTVDDAYISFRYLRNFGQGLGLVFNAGERVEGYSHPLWMVLLLPISLLRKPEQIVLCAKVLGLLCTAGTLMVLWRFVGKLLPVAGATALLLWLLAPGTHVYASCGLETPLLALLLTWALERHNAKAPAWQTAILLGLAAVTRPEAPIYAIAWFACWWRPAHPLRTVGVVLLALALPWIAWEVFRISYYQQWLPNTFFAKPPGTFGGKFGIAYALPMLGACCLPLTVLAHRTRGAEVRTAGALCVAALVFVAYTQGDWMPFWRFLVPVWPAAVYQLAVGVDELARRGLPTRAVAAISIIIGTVTLSAPIPAFVRGEGLYDLMRGSHQIKGGEWLAAHVKPDDDVATIRLGGIAWKLPTYRMRDIAGLTAAAAGQHLWERKGNIDWADHPFRVSPPTWIAAVHQQGQTMYHGDEALTRDLQTSYTLASEVPQGPGATWHFYRLNTDAR